MRPGKRASALGCVVVLIALSGCSPVAGTAPASTAELAVGTFTAIPTFTAAAPTVAAPTQAAIPLQPLPTTTVGELYVTVNTDNVNLRTRPGTTFPVSRLLAKGTRLQLLGHAPGNEWLLVETDSQVQGWLLYWLVEGGHDDGTTPEVTPVDVLIVRGRVVDRAGVPISGLGYAVTQGTGSTAPRTDATTDTSGQFYAYLPATATGTWQVSYASMACTSNTMDANCNCIGTCGHSDPESVPISLPPQGVVEFVWR